MKPCTIEQLRDALEQEDGIGEYIIKKALDIIPGGAIDMSKETLNPNPKYFYYIDVEYPEHKYGETNPPLIHHTELLALFITPHGVKLRCSKRNAVLFRNYPDVEHLAAKLIIKIRELLGIKMVF